MWIRQNQNPAGNNVDDCAVRAISVATGKSWDRIYTEMCLGGFDIKDMAHADKVWHKVLKDNGFHRHSLPERCPDCYTVADFCSDHQNGIYVLAVPNHVVAVVDGHWVDTWDSGNETPFYYFCRED